MKRERLVRICHASPESVSLFTAEYQEKFLDLAISHEHNLLKIRGEAASEAQIETLIESLKRQFPTQILVEGANDLPKVIYNEMVARKESLALAESCTGGQIAVQCTQQPGASDYFVGGVVAYSNNLKEKLLGVSKELLTTYGAASWQVVEAMCKGLFPLSDWAVATSGFVGPTAGEGLSVGTVFVALGRRGEKLDSGQLSLPEGLSREGYIRCVSQWAMEALLRKLLFGVELFYDH